MRHQELRLGDQPLEPFLLQMLGRELAQQHRDLPVLHHLVGEAGIAARDFLGDQREGLDLGALLQLDAAEFLRHAERADADLLGLFQDVRRQPVLRHHRPFVLPVLLDERQHHVVDEIAAALPHHALFFRQAAVAGIRSASSFLPDNAGQHRGTSCYAVVRRVALYAAFAVRQELAHAVERLQDVLGRIGVGQPHIAFAENAEIGPADDGDAGIVEQREASSLAFQPVRLMLGKA